MAGFCPFSSRLSWDRRSIHLYESSWLSASVSKVLTWNFCCRLITTEPETPIQFMAFIPPQAYISVTNRVSVVCVYSSCCKRQQGYIIGFWAWGENCLLKFSSCETLQLTSLPCLLHLAALALCACPCGLMHKKIASVHTVFRTVGWVVALMAWSLNWTILVGPSQAATLIRRHTDGTSIQMMGY